MPAAHEDPEGLNILATGLQTVESGCSAARAHRYRRRPPGPRRKCEHVPRAPPCRETRQGHGSFGCGVRIATPRRRQRRRRAGQAATVSWRPPPFTSVCDAFIGATRAHQGQRGVPVTLHRTSGPSTRRWPLAARICRCPRGHAELSAFTSLDRRDRRVARWTFPVSIAESRRLQLPRQRPDRDCGTGRRPVRGLLRDDRHFHGSRSGTPRSDVAPLGFWLAGCG